ncbi:hydrogenase maturation protease [Coprobacter tertius]|uniref:Hydrogenase maturation protease n=1 Tax=Coprobacter tertius TaxID=2944915 RepID=A0ABT1MHK1_9BACT|nr:hydrogenase maturation protease [Coprobacter tertius]MCP9612124.1 hydrogenase maturation protease [Coprobacter tertius]
MKEKKILVLGVGNLVLKDEGVGIHTIQVLEKMDLPPNVEILDGGTGGIFLIGTLQEYEHVIMIDATLDTNKPGTIRRLKPKFSSDYPILLSAHEIGLKDMIDAMLVQEKIPDIDLLAVTAKEVQEIGMQLSPEVESAIPEIILKVFSIINEIKSYN